MNPSKIMFDVPDGVMIILVEADDPQHPPGDVGAEHTWRVCRVGWDE